MKFDDLTISDSLYLQRCAMKISQARLAKLARVSRNYISMIERGNTDHLTIGTLDKLCRALSLKIDYVITPTGDIDMDKYRSYVPGYEPKYCQCTVSYPTTMANTCANCGRPQKDL